MKTRLGLWLLCSVGIIACGSPTTPDLPTVNGGWTGPLDSERTLTLVLKESREDQSVAGSGIITTSTGGIRVEVLAGVNAFPFVSLTLLMDGSEEFSLVATTTPGVTGSSAAIGAAEARTMTGELNGAGIVRHQFVLTKQDSLTIPR